VSVTRSLACAGIKPPSPGIVAYRQAAVSRRCAQAQRRRRPAR